MVNVLPDPDVLLPDLPRMFQLPAVGDKAPPESPVIVSPAPDPFNVTNPLASTEKRDESKLHKPILVASVAAIAWEICTSRAIVLAPVPSVLTGLVPAATTAPLNVIAPPAATTGVVPVCMLILVMAPDPPIRETKPLVSTVNCAELKEQVPTFVPSVAAIAREYGCQLVVARVRVPANEALLRKTTSSYVNVPAPAPEIAGLLLESTIALIRLIDPEEDMVRAGVDPVLNRQLAKVPVELLEHVTV